MALAGIRVLEFAGLAPAPFCGMILADFGADVIRVDRAGTSANPDNLARGKRSIAIDLKKGTELVRKLVQKVCQQKWNKNTQTCSSLIFKGYI
jgi:alpha-methylacyl-CoA racemase